MTPYTSKKHQVEARLTSNSMASNSMVSTYSKRAKKYHNKKIPRLNVAFFCDIYLIYYFVFARGIKPLASLHFTFETASNLVILSV